MSAVTTKNAPSDTPVAFITGASSGLGAAIAQRFAAEGYRVAGVAHKEQDVAEELAKIGSEQETLALGADVSDPHEVENAVRQAVARWGRIDVVVANAGVNGVWAPLAELKPEEWKKTLSVNLDGTFYTIKAALSALQASRGAVVVMSSVNGTRIFSNSGATAYACSKAGQVALAKMLALELASDRIRVNTVCPGAIQTPIHDKTERRNLDEAQEPVKFPEGNIPLTDGEQGTPEQVADLVYFLCSPQSSHITGSVVYIDGAQSLLQG